MQRGYRIMLLINNGLRWVVFSTLAFFLGVSHANLKQEVPDPVHDVAVPQVESSRAESSKDEYPRVGESLFDEIFLKRFADSTVYEIPFPFDNLVAKLESLLGRSINGKQNSLSSVVLPVGRCINRYAASPDYFSYPRIVLSTGYEDHGGDRNLPFLKDRLFIGYQEKARALEVISYNKHVGRFEFQRVQNYDKGEQPIVQYAERDQCTGCHQNQGPIFPQAPWDETENNSEIFDLLSNALSNPNLEPPVYRGSDVTDVDSSTNRANKLAMYQHFWQDACQGESEGQEIRCRAGLAELIVNHRLQERSRVLPSSSLISDYFIPQTIDKIGQIWPQGISILSSDVSNENPLVNGIEAHLQLANELKQPRSWMINWKPDNIFSMIEGLGDFIPLSDMRELDKALYRSALDFGSETKLLGKCDLKLSSNSEENLSGTKLSPLSQAVDLSVSCQFESELSGITRHLVGDLYIESGKVNDLPVYSRMVLDSENTILSLAHDGGAVVSEGAFWKLRLNLFDSKHKFHARLPGVGIISTMELRWPKLYSSEKDARENSAVNSTVTGDIELSILNEYRAFNFALSNLINSTEKGEFDGLSADSFLARAMMRALIDGVGQFESNN